MLVAAGQLMDYCPDADSLFDESLTLDIEAARDISPETFEVPIGGRWFLSDIAGFSKSYTHLYSFLYCTKPRFVTNIGEKVTRYLRSPWKGGYSRVNFFDALHRQVPSIHDMRVAGYRYASPGEIKIEALTSVGADVSDLILAYINNMQEVERSIRAIDVAMNAAKVKKQDLSSVSDTGLFVTDDQLSTIKDRVAHIAYLTGLSTEVALIRAASPNSIVTAKVVMALFKQIKKISDFQVAGMLDLTRPPTPVTQ